MECGGFFCRDAGKKRGIFVFPPGIDVDADPVHLGSQTPGLTGPGLVAPMPPGIDASQGLGDPGVYGSIIHGGVGIETDAGDYLLIPG